MSAIIYLLTNTINGKQYVGQTSRGLDVRWYYHCYDANNGGTRHLCRAIRKYGADAFTREILEHTTIEDVNERETYWIAELKTQEHGYNMTEGGGGVRGWVASEEARAKMSAVRSGENHPLYGKTHSAEARAKMSAAKMGEKSPWYGKKLSAETRAKISAAKAGKTFSTEHRAKLSAAKAGTTHSAETRAKMSAVKAGKTFSAEHRAKLSAAQKLRARLKRIQAPLATIECDILV